jgi:tripartite-type tricarboxylate transporter receptor subunit TctC
VYTTQPNGYTLGMINLSVGTFSGDILTPVEYDLTNFSGVGTWSVDYDLILVKGDSPYSTLEDLQNAGELKASFGGTGEPSWVAGVMLAEAAGIDFRYLTGFEGLVDMMLAVVRGDADVVSANPETAGPLIESGDLVPILILAEERDPEYPDVPSIAELGYPGLGAALPSYRTFVTTPGVPDEVLTILLDAFWAGTQDKELQDLAVQARVPINSAMRGDKLEELISTVGAEFEKVRSIVEAALKEAQL